MGDIANSIIGLVGFRCCGKSRLRQMLVERGYSVFDTNSVRTGDDDANIASLDEILHRYGKGRSYMYFVERELKKFVSSVPEIAFVDSLKTAADADVVKEMFPSRHVEIWYLHAPSEVRMRRYIERDIRTGIRRDDLRAHDAALEKYGIWELIKAASEVIDMADDLGEIENRVSHSIRRSLNRSFGRLDGKAPDSKGPNDDDLGWIAVHQRPVS